MTAWRRAIVLLLAAAGAAANGTRAEGACTGGDATLCLAGERFAVQASWQDATGGSGAGQALPLTTDTGAFWFFTTGNLELVVKVLDGRWLNGHWWVFGGALSDVAYTVTVTDAATGAVRTYANPLGELASFADTGAFADGPGAAALPHLAPRPSAAAVWSELLGGLPPPAVTPNRSVLPTVADLVVSLAQTTCDPCQGGRAGVSLTATVTNLGPDPDPQVHIQSVVPANGTTPVEGSGSASQGVLSGPFYHRPSQVHYWDLDVGELSPGQSATLSCSVDLDMAAPAESTFVVDTPPSVAEALEHRAVTAWDQAQLPEDWGLSGEAEWVDDRSAAPTEGCRPLHGFTAGHVALIDRGTCEFVLKACGAMAAGATGVVFVNNRPDQPLDAIPIEGWWECGQGYDFPAAFLTQADGDRLRQTMLVEGQRVIATFGHLHPPGPWQLEAAASAYDPDTLDYNHATAAWTVNPPDCAAPAAPSDLRASATDVPSGMPYSLFWTGPAEGVTFELEEATDPGFADPTSVPVDGTTWTVSHALAAPATYHYRLRSVAPCSSVSAWSEAVSVTVGGSSTCAAGAGALCLAGWRFQVEVAWQDGVGGSGTGQALPLTPDTGAFWFFTAGNLEVVVKVLDGRWLNGHWWVFGGALSDVAYTVTVTDTATGAVHTYANPLGELGSFADTAAFAE